MYDQLIAQTIVQREMSDKHYVLSEKPQSAERIKGSLNKVLRFTLSPEKAAELELPTQEVFYKRLKDLKNNSLALEYQAVAAALYRLFLGPDRVPETRVVYDENGIGKGTISAALPNWVPLSEFIKEKVNSNLPQDKPRFPEDSDWDDTRDFRRRHYFPEKIVHQLVEDGLVPVYVISYFLANPDAHFDNVGYSNGKICYLDFDKALWPLVETFYSDADDDTSVESKATERMPLESFYLGENFVKLPHDEYFPWFNKNTFSFGNKIDPEYDTTPALADRVQSALGFIDQQFFALLKILFTPLPDIEACITSFIKDKKHQEDILKFIIIRTQQFLNACFDNDQFCEWLLKDKENLEQRLVASFKSYYPETIIGERLVLIKNVYKGFLKQVEKAFSGEELHNSSEHSTDTSYEDAREDSSSDSTEFPPSEPNDNPVQATTETLTTIPSHATSRFILMPPPTPTLPREQDVSQSTSTPNLNYNHN